MAFLKERHWAQLEDWSHLGFIVGGLLLLVSFVLVGVRDAMAVNMPELLISIFALPGIVIILLVGLLGFYPHLSEAAPRLALGGAVASVIGGLSLIVTTIGAIILQLTTETGFTQAEDVPLFLVLFFLVLGTFFLSFLLYGIGSVWTHQPSRSIGALLVIAAVEPASPFLFDIVGVDSGQFGAEITLGIAALAIVGIGVLLRANRTTASPPQTAPA